MKQSTFEFNKEMIFAEFGAFLGAPLLPLIITLFTSDTIVLSLSTLLGAQIGATIVWLIMRTYHQKRRKTFTLRKMSKDILYFTPVASIIAILTYYPVLFYLTHYFLSNGTNIVLSALPSQIIAFTIFLAAMNVYRHYLNKHYNVDL